MSTEPLQSDNVQPVTEAATTVTAPVQEAEKPTLTQAQFEAALKDRLEQEKRQRQKAADEAASKARSEELAAKEEWKVLAEQREKELAELKDTLNKQTVKELKRDIAASIGLPDYLAERLQGSTKEELEADAKAIYEKLPKEAQKQRTPGVHPTNPAGNGELANETKAERMKRLGF
jgi:hypothetical protein